MKNVIVNSLLFNSKSLIIIVSKHQFIIVDGVIEYESILLSVQYKLVQSR